MWENLKTMRLQIWPNPSTDFIYAQTNMSGMVYWYDLAGRLLDQRITVPGEAIRFVTNGMSAGTYLLLFRAENGQLQTQKFIIN